MDDPRFISARSTTDRATGPSAPRTPRTATQDEIARAIQRLVQVQFRQHAPPNRPPSREQLSALIWGAISTSSNQFLRHSDIPPALQSALRSLLPQTRPLIDSASAGIVNWAVAHPGTVSSVQWYFNQTGHNFQVEKAFMCAFFEGLIEAANRNSRRVWNERGVANIAAHVAVALQSANPLFPPTFFLFLYGTGFAIVRDTIGTIGMLKRYWHDPDRMFLDILLMLLLFCSYAFESTAAAQTAARRLGGEVASGMVGSVTAAIFPDPTARHGDGAYLFMEAGQNFIREQPEFVRDVASLVMVPFAVGALAGPLLLDLVMTLIGIFFPEVSLGAILARSPRVAQLINVARTVIPDAGNLRHRMPDLFEGHADVPNVRATSHRGTGSRGLPGETPAPAAAPGQRPVAPASAPPSPPSGPAPPVQRGRVQGMTPEQRMGWRSQRVMRSVNEFIEKFGAKLATDPETRIAVAAMFEYSSSVTGEGARHTFQQSRSIASGELRILMDFLTDPEVERVRLIPSESGPGAVRTPDMVVRYTDGVTMRAEVRTITAAQARQRPRAGTVPTHRGITRSTIREHIRQKIMPRRGVSQLAVDGRDLPDGGSLELVIHDPVTFDVVDGTRAALSELGPRLADPQYSFFRRLRVTYLQRDGPGEASRRLSATFVRQADGSYRHVPGR